MELADGVGRQPFKLSVRRIKVRDTSGNRWGRTRMRDPTRDVIAGCKSKKLNRELPPTSWPRLEIWPQSQHSCNPGSVTDKRSGITALSPQAIYTNAQQSIKRNIATDWKCHRVHWKLPKKRTVQSKFLLWKMKKCLPRKQYYQAGSITRFL